MRASPVEIEGLAGELLEPAGLGPWPHALMIAGSGPTDRNGNSPAGLRTDAYRLLAEALADRGIASLRYDKRGVGASRVLATAESDVTIETFVADAIKVAEWLSARPFCARLALIGHSEGALIGALAVSKTSVDRLVYLCGPGVSFGETLRRQLAAGHLPEEFRRSAAEAIDEFERTGSVLRVPPGLAAIFRSSVQPFLRSIWRIDPRGELTRAIAAGQSVLVVAGGADAQISREESARLVDQQPGQNAVWFATMSHTLKDATGRSQQALYTDAALPLMPGLANEISAFINA